MGVAWGGDPARHDVDRVDLLAVSGDPLQAPTLRGTDLDRELRPELREESLQRRPLAEGHLPPLAAEDVRRPVRHAAPVATGASPGRKKPGWRSARAASASPSERLVRLSI